MKELWYKTKFTIEITYQELRDIQGICNNYLIMHPELKDVHKGTNTNYEQCEKYHTEIAKIIDKKYHEGYKI